MNCHKAIKEYKGDPIFHENGIQVNGTAEIQKLYSYAGWNPEAKKYDKPEATGNAAISARLPYIMATSRFAHYLKVMARDKIGSFMEASDCEMWLNNWISQYVNATEGAGQESRAKYPLRDAMIQVREVEGAPGSYSAVAHLQPWLQFEELTTSMRLVARIPKQA